ncbi:MAG: ATP-binding cassette domain-containing protein [Candidatus Electryonea clarkiae]|nr:ATP-binding cassette domain-containing protein [Candidatus Electryonea clarkiae]
MIELVNIKKSFGEKPVLRNVNLTVEEGESVVIIGRSGSGKSVAFRHILRLIKPDEGRVYVEGRDISTLSRKGLYKVLENIGVLFQNSALWDSMNVFENIALALRRHKMCGGENGIRKRVYDCLDMVGLGMTGISGTGGVEIIGTRMPSELSGGMRKRVGLARAIAPNPAYMLYDEPTTGLDPIMSGIINRLIKRLNKELNVTSLTITHDMHSASTIADRIVLLHKGEFKDLGTPDEANSNDDPIVRQFIHGEDGPIHPVLTDHFEKVHVHHS